MMNALLAVMQFERLFFARPLPTYALVVLVAGVLGLSVYLYRRSWGLTPWVRVSLGLARLVVLSLVVLMMLEPMAVMRETETRRRALPVLVDVSQSMSIRDPRKHAGDLAEAARALGLLPADVQGSDDEIALLLNLDQRQAIAAATRLDLATKLLTETARPVFEKLAKDVDVSYYAFGKDLRMISDEGEFVGVTLPGLSASDPKSSIAESLELVAASSAEKPAGIVLFSDGIESGSALHADAVLRDLGARGIPVYAVPVGLTAPDDVSIRTIIMQEVVYSGDRVPVRVQIESKGYEKRTAQLVVLLNDRRIASRTVHLQGGLQFEEIDFNVDVYEKGAVKIEVAIEPFDDEVSVENNRVEQTIRVVNEKVNVLYIEGNPRWEYRYLRAILKRDPRINATFIASNAGPEVARNSPEHIARFPNLREQAFKYDLVILGDVDSAFFSAEEMTILDELIRDRGASLLMLCGPTYSPGSYAGTPIEAMLPIRFEPDAKWEPVPRSVYPVLTPEGRSSLVMTLENEPELNDRVWSRMAPMDLLPPLLGAKPGASVLMVLSDSTDRDQGYPLVAWQRYGTGKCMSIATDRLWRLRYKTGDKYHWRVWSQCIQFMTLSRLMGEHKRIRLETDQAVYPSGSQCRLYAHVLDKDFEPVSQPAFQVEVVRLDGPEIKDTVSLQPDRSRVGLYEGHYTPPVAGRYRLEANENDQRFSNTTEFQVADVNRELVDANVDVENLDRIAALTGGERLSMQHLDKLVSLVNRDPVVTSTVSERALWDNGWILALLVGLTGLEWIQRRRFDLP